MNYQFENLGPERFQMFCQSLLVKEHPNMQCFPVGQPDGGRDAVQYLPAADGSSEFIVYQVKFVRRPEKITDYGEWLEEIVRNEAPKANVLVERGAQEYYLITNVPGTAHLDVGSIDKASRILTDQLGIPAKCWWRDDLNRKLDNAYDLKWMYPEVMSGPDMLRAIIESGLTDDRERRTNTLRTFIGSQYEQDQEVRFKQVDLQNNLLDLFVDVPMILRAPSRRRHDNVDRWRIIYHSVARRLIESSVGASAVYTGRPVGAYFVEDPDIEIPIGAASVLLHPSFQQQVPFLVLEGAPGQGKSTLAQYVCQAHRCTILKRSASLAQFPSACRPSSVRFPIKVDLRDFAIWLNKQDPFTPHEQSTAPTGWHKSLEAFLAALVRHHAGGMSFSVDDLHAVAKVTALLLVLDGFDEVAEPATRNEVVAEVVAGVKRLRLACPSIQVIITSRPAAFANSPGFPEELFPHFELTAVTRQQIDDYANKWCKRDIFQKGSEPK